MTTPICDFVAEYVKKNYSRFHMPGHKGRDFLGFERYDITEIDGADVLYSADGIIKQSEENASFLFGSRCTCYTTEGASHLIRTMISAVSLLATSKGATRPLILAARNVHKSFIYACASADVQVEWIYPRNFTHYCQCLITDVDLEKAIESCPTLPDAVYITSPDYLGNIADISSISRVCRKHGILLLVDNAHGAYLNFTKESCHPLKAGADVCCDSAHKTLPVITGGAYLHFGHDCPENYIRAAQKMLPVYATTSPSYLILQSLDLCNNYIEKDYPARLQETIDKIKELKTKISSLGFYVENTEPLKIVVNICKSGYTQEDFTKLLDENKIAIEMCDNEYAVFMISPENDNSDFEKLQRFFETLPTITSDFSHEQEVINTPICHKTALPIRQAVFAESISIPASDSIGKICASPVIACPPAVPIVISGEIILSEDVLLMKRYNINYIDVIK